MDWLSSGLYSPLLEDRPVAESTMELHSSTLQVFLLVLAAISALLWRIWNSGWRTKWPPGPRAWPIIGHLHLLGELPHQSLCKLSQTYGPLMGLRLGAVPTIVASSPQMAKEILKTHDLVFAYRPHLAALEHMYFGSKSMASLPCGPVWKLMRQLCASELFHAKRLASFRHVREDEVGSLARWVVQMGQQGQKMVELRPSMVAASNNIICRMAMGKKLSDVSSKMRSDGGKHELLFLVEELMFLVAVFHVGDFIPWLSWLDPHGYLKRMKAAAGGAKALMQDVIDQRRQERAGRTFAESPPQDFLDVLLAASADPNPRVRISDDHIMALILDLFAGGSDTSSLTVEWALADLINNPRTMRKLKEELDSVVGKARLVTEGDIENLPYLGLVVKESMRLRPVVPLVAPRQSIEECQIGVYKIPSKTRAFVNAWAIARDPSIWERPLEFWPERFNNDNVDLRGQSFNLLPFGAGRRKCPGWELGLLNIHLMLASLIQGFDWSLVSPSSPNYGSSTQLLDMSERFGMTITMDKPLNAFAIPRLPLHIY